MVLVGDHEPSKVYVAAKELACAEVGIATRRLALPPLAPPAAVEHALRELNGDPAIDGVLLQVARVGARAGVSGRLTRGPLQLPLPPHLKAATPLFKSLIAAHKDVDGFHASNIGALVLVRGARAPRVLSYAGYRRTLRRCSHALRRA